MAKKKSRDLAEEDILDFIHPDDEVEEEVWQDADPEYLEMLKRIKEKKN